MEINTQKSQGTNEPKSGVILNFIKAFQVKEDQKTTPFQYDPESLELLESIKSAKQEWDSASMNFEHAFEKELVDYYTYRMKAGEVKYEYLIRKAKEKGIKVEKLESIQQSRLT